MTHHIPAVVGAATLAAAQQLGSLLGAEMADGDLLEDACGVVHMNYGLTVFGHVHVGIGDGDCFAEPLWQVVEGEPLHPALCVLHHWMTRERK
jgi:hypothetical protein